MPVRTCIECGITFEGYKSARLCPECKIHRQTLRNKRHEELLAAGMSRKIGSTVFCERCGKPFVLTTGSKKFCDVCQQSKPPKILIIEHPDCTLKGLRLEAGFTRAQLAENINIDVSIIEDWENGLFRPSYDSLKKLSKLYRIKPKNIKF